MVCAEPAPGQLRRLFEALGVEVIEVGAGGSIPGSHWGEPEAGLLGRSLYVRRDTPVHSALHEGCHAVCMESERRRRTYHAT